MECDILLVGGTRPNFIKISPISKAFDAENIKYEIVHTGQHYDYGLDGIFFEQFNLKPPAVHLGVGSGIHGWQTAEILRKFEEVCVEVKPRIVFVVGDVNSTLACALAAVKLNIPVAHQEAGCRSVNKYQVEEINRRIVDHISSILFVNVPRDRTNLLNEGISDDSIHVVGDVVSDNLKQCLNVIPKDRVHDKKYCVVTIHRDFNTDNVYRLTEILNGLHRLASKIDIIFPMHPRTKKRIKDYKLEYLLRNINVIEPLGYLDFIRLLRDAEFVVTDSGGLQIETTLLNKYCMNICDVSASHHTVEYGTNVILNNMNSDKIYEMGICMMSNVPNITLPNEISELMDGKASYRIAQIIRNMIK
jgi:UDP-N-acetylglucosamine 2-epimerase (non-hydrolysing)